MTDWPSRNPRFPDEINNPPGSALGEFARLFLGLGLATTVATLLLITVAGWLSPLIPFSWEARLTQGINYDAGDPDAVEALSELGHALAAHVDLDESVKLHFHLLDSPVPNAFATLGGHIVVTRGLIRQVSSENGLAMVLGHEIAHIHHRDPIRQLGRGAVLALTWALVTGSTGQTGLESVLGAGGMLGMLTFSREMEHQADAMALDILEAHYGHTSGADEFFRQMADRDRLPEWSEFMLTHPLTERRLALVEQRGLDGHVESTRPLPSVLSRWADAE
jgi:predicted Zn-dependent protease